jgi:hypothetical protein
VLANSAMLATDHDRPAAPTVARIPDGTSKQRPPRGIRGGHDRDRAAVKPIWVYEQLLDRDPEAYAPSSPTATCKGNQAARVNVRGAAVITVRFAHSSPSSIEAVAEAFPQPRPGPVQDRPLLPRRQAKSLADLGSIHGRAHRG